MFHQYCITEESAKIIPDAYVFFFIYNTHTEYIILLTTKMSNYFL